MPSRTREGEVCPHKIIDDFGFCYSLGVGLGTIVNGIRGLFAGPKKRKFATAVEMIRRRVPSFACSFGLWGGAFGVAQCALLLYTHHDSVLNQAIAGGFAGGLLNIRGGFHFMQRGAVSGFVLLGLMGLGEKVLNKYQHRKMILFNQKVEEFKYQMMLYHKKMQNPELYASVTVKSEEELEAMREELENMQKQLMGGSLFG